MPTAVYGFIGRFEREEHYQAHNGEFHPPFASSAEFEAAGITFLTKPMSGTMMEGVRRNGDVIRLDTATDEFAICDRDGVLRTYYRANPQRHKQPNNVVYFRGQCAK